MTSSSELFLLLRYPLGSNLQVFLELMVNVRMVPVSVMPWSAGKPLVWDPTCSDTFATSNLRAATHAAGQVAAIAESRKESKYYSFLSQCHIFIPISVESTGTFGPPHRIFCERPWKENHMAILYLQGDSIFLRQRLSAAIQCGNALSVLGTCTSLPPLPDS